MKHTRSLFILLLLLFAVSSCKTELPIEEPDELQTYVEPETEYEAGYVRILITESLSDKMDVAERKGMQRVKAMKADNVLSKLKVRTMNRTFPHAGRYEERTRKEGLHLWYDVEFDADVPLDEITAGLGEVAGIMEVELRPVVQRYGSDEVIEYVKEVVHKQRTLQSTSSLPMDDPLLPDQWHYQNDGSLGSKYIQGADINLFDAWSYTQGTPDVIVSIVDGGIEYTHEDLAANMWINQAEKNGTSGIDDDGNGYRDDIHGYNFVADVGKIVPHDHGTHVAGTVAAVSNNGKGVSGIAGGNGSPGSGVRLMSCQIFVDSDDPYSSQAGRKGAEAIKYGADNGAVISQNSWGYPTLTQIPGSDKAAIDYFIKYAGIDENGNQTGPMRGGIVIFASGNEDRSQAAPANYEPVVAVSSLAADYKKAYYSNYGEWMNLAAPGGDVMSFGNKGTVLSTVVGNKYGYMQGTSMACPHVSGVAALVVSKMKGQGFNPDMLKARLYGSSTNVDQYNSSYAGKLGGLVNATLALASGGTIPPDKVTSISGTAVSNNVNLEWTVPSDQDDGKPSGFNVYYRKSSLSGINVSNPPSDVLVRNFSIGNKNVGDVFNAIVSDLEFETTYYFAVSGYDVSGNLALLSPQTTVTTLKNNPPKISTDDDLSFELKAYQTSTIMFEGYDPDDHHISWSLDPEIEGVELNDLRAGKAQLTVTGALVNPGTYNTNVVLSDMYGATDQLKVSFKVIENSPPESVKNFENYILNGLSVQQVLNLEEFFVDKDGENLRYQITNSSPKVLHVNASDNKLYMVSLFYGVSQVTVTATDAIGESVTQTFGVLVRDSDVPVDIYPNPMVDNLYVRTGKDTECEVTIYSASGATVYNEKVFASPFAPHMIDVAAYAGGVYNLTVKYDDIEYNKQMIKR